MTETPILATKARTLRSLEGRLASARVLPQVRLTVALWRKDAAAARAQVAQAFDAAPLVVRSSALSEDGAEASLAGAYTSILDVRGSDALSEAIDAVIASYGDGATDDDEILVQPMLQGVTLSGVAFSHDPATCAPYRVITAHRGSDTSAVTSGQGDVQTYVAARAATATDPEYTPVLALMDELESLFPGRPLDIEFAMTEGEALPTLLQARPLVLPQDRAVMSGADHADLLTRLHARICAAQRPHPFLHGRSTVFGVMPDWNPAEIIGLRPRPLALSLYKNLVTDATWAYQRNNYGYRNLRSFPLVQTFAGQPFVDVRLSFNSFIPRDLDASLADRLVDYYTERLASAPNLHDKIEFEIVFSCYSLDLPERLEVLQEAGFTQKECRTLAKSLRRLTNGIIDRKAGLWRTDAAKIDTLRARHETIAASDLGPLERIYWLLEDCKRYGTLPFAGLARAGFVAVQMLRSLVSTGIFTEADYQSFLRSLSTVSGQFSRDLASLDRTSFLARYGHLRPGTYDITSPRYDAAPDLYLGGRDRSAAPLRDDAQAPEGHGATFGLSLDQMRALQERLAAHKLSVDVIDLMEFLHAGIELREYAKFVFTRNLSDALAVFEDWGRQMGFSSDDLSYANIHIVTELHAGTDDPRETIQRSIEEGRARYAEARRVWLPPLITTPDDVHAFHVTEAEPNYVTQGEITGPVIALQPGQGGSADLKGAIVFIPNADPGFDWLFTQGIGGLVTAFGGVNSHMAIRAGELGLPAVIGAGEALFGRWSKSRSLRIDCAARRVEALS